MRYVGLTVPLWAEIGVGKACAAWKGIRRCRVPSVLSTGPTPLCWRLLTHTWAPRNREGEEYEVAECDSRLRPSEAQLRCRAALWKEPHDQTMSSNTRGRHGGIPKRPIPD